MSESPRRPLTVTAWVPHGASARGLQVEDKGWWYHAHAIAPTWRRFHARPESLLQRLRDGGATVQGGAEGGAVLVEGQMQVQRRRL